jgi:hypothetical protein
MLSLWLTITACASIGNYANNNPKSFQFNNTDEYRLEVARKVQKNWVISKDGNDRDKPKAKIIFKVLPSGEIHDIFFVERSGLNELDNSAYAAIMNSNPVQPYLNHLDEPYILIGIIFDPKVKEVKKDTN